ncbi:MAG: hypothetical protein ACPIOQ_59210, partial [Promethearchaeia archaeon]
GGPPRERQVTLHSGGSVQQRVISERATCFTRGDLPKVGWLPSGSLGRRLQLSGYVCQHNGRSRLAGQSA